MLSIGAIIVMPALLTKMSRRPSSPTADSTRDLAWAGIRLDDRSVPASLSYLLSHRFRMLL